MLTFRFYTVLPRSEPRAELNYADLRIRVNRIVSAHNITARINFNISAKEKATKKKLILANIITVSLKMYLLTKRHDVGRAEHFTALPT
jgi:hypothetical protein